MYNKQQKIFNGNCYWLNLLEHFLDSFFRKNILSDNRKIYRLQHVRSLTKRQRKKSSCRIPKVLGEDNIASMVGLSGIHQNY